MARSDSGGGSGGAKGGGKGRYQVLRKEAARVYGRASGNKARTAIGKIRSELPRGAKAGKLGPWSLVKRNPR